MWCITHYDYINELPESMENILVFPVSNVLFCTGTQLEGGGSAAAPRGGKIDHKMRQRNILKIAVHWTVVDRYQHFVVKIALAPNSNCQPAKARMSL